MSQVQPTSPDPTNSEPIHSNSTNPDVVSSDPVNSDAVNTDPVQSSPVNTDLVESDPVESSPVEFDPVEFDPVESSSVESTLIEATPIKATPIKATPIKATPIKATPIEATPIESEPISDTQKSRGESPLSQSPEVAHQSPEIISEKSVQSKTLQTVQQVWQVIQPQLKALTILLLKVIIQGLQSLLGWLETKPKEETSARSPVASGEGLDSISSASGANQTGLVAETQTAKVALESPAAAADDSVSQSTLPSKGSDSDTERSLGQEFAILWQQIQAWWQQTLPSIRAVLPASVNDKVSDDRGLTGAIAGILAVIIWFTSSLFADHSPSQEATPSQPAPTKPVSTVQKSANQGSANQEFAKSPAARPSIQERSQEKTASQDPTAAKSPPVNPSLSPKDQPADSQTTPPPKQSNQPAAPSVLPSGSPAPKPSAPPLRLTPEQKLIARIQDQVAEVSNQYVGGLIQSVQANFRASRLTVKVGNGWYDLAPAQQDKLANDLLKRAKQLDFSKLELTSPDNTLLARSPVVGAEMIIMQRTSRASVDRSQEVMVPRPQAQQELEILKEVSRQEVEESTQKAESKQKAVESTQKTESKAAGKKQEAEE
jgi:hypothetical protein